MAAPLVVNSGPGISPDFYAPLMQAELFRQSRRGPALEILTRSADRRGDSDLMQMMLAVLAMQSQQENAAAEREITRAAMAEDKLERNRMHVADQAANAQSVLQDRLLLGRDKIAKAESDALEKLVRQRDAGIVRANRLLSPVDDIVTRIHAKQWDDRDIPGKMQATYGIYQNALNAAMEIPNEFERAAAIRTINDHAERVASMLPVNRDRDTDTAASQFTSNVLTKTRRHVDQFAGENIWIAAEEGIRKRAQEDYYRHENAVRGFANQMQSVSLDDPVESRRLINEVRSQLSEYMYDLSPDYSTSLFGGSLTDEQMAEVRNNEAFRISGSRDYAPPPSERSPAAPEDPAAGMKSYATEQYVKGNLASAGVGATAVLGANVGRAFGDPIGTIDAVTRALSGKSSAPVGAGTRGGGQLVGMPGVEPGVRAMNAIAGLFGGGPKVAPLPGAGTLVQNPDGTVSTERTITVEMDGKHYIIPTLVGGKQLSKDEAIRKAKSVGLGKYPSFPTPTEANRYAVERSDAIGRSLIGRSISPPLVPSSGSRSALGDYSPAVEMFTNRPMTEWPSLNNRIDDGPIPRSPGAISTTGIPVFPKKMFDGWQQSTTSGTATTMTSPVPVPNPEDDLRAEIERIMGASAPRYPADYPWNDYDTYRVGLSGMPEFLGRKPANFTGAPEYIRGGW